MSLTEAQERFAQHFLATTHHEAGHAFAALLLSIEIDAMAFTYPQAHAGYATGDNPLYGQDLDRLTEHGIQSAERMIVVALAGYHSEMLVGASQEVAQLGALSDIAVARHFAEVLARQSSLSSARNDHFRRGLLRTLDMISFYTPHIAALAQALMEVTEATPENDAAHGSLDHGQMLAALKGFSFDKARDNIQLW